MDVDNGAVIDYPVSIQHRGLGAMRSGGNSVLVLHSMVSLCNVIACCTSMKGGLQEPVSPAGSILTAGVCSIRGLELPGM